MVRPAKRSARSTLQYHLGHPSVRALMRLDEDMRALIEQIGEVSVDIDGDGYVALARAICDQQISGAVATAIWNRFEALCGGAVSADVVTKLGEDALRSVGFSRMKARYQLDLARHVVDGLLDFDELATLDDEAVIERLTTVKGIGRWTAQMYLIFSLEREDVFATADGGLRRSVALLKGVPVDAPAALIEALAEDWAPYRTVASLYLWRGLGQGALQAL